MQHIYPADDLLPHITEGMDCPCCSRLEDDIVIHNSWWGYEQNEPGNQYKAPVITLRIDGDQWCALAGDDLQSGYSGFGDTPEMALSNLLEGYKEPPLITDEHVWAALRNEEITMSRAAELLGLPLIEVREILNNGD